MDRKDDEVKRLAYFAAILHMEDPERNQTLRPQHLDYLNNLYEQGKVHLKGPFTDGAGGLVIYVADTRGCGGNSQK